MYTCYALIYAHIDLKPLFIAYTICISRTIIKIKQNTISFKKVELIAIQTYYIFYLYFCFTNLII